MQGHDVLAQAQTGTGKTAAFAIPIVERIDIKRREVQALVIEPTRELAVQVAESAHALAQDRGVTVLPIYGGQPYERQLRGLRQGAQIVVGTPGRLTDHIRRGTLNLSAVRTIVLDEADEMLDMGFVEEIEFILDAAPAERQLALFSATVPRRIEMLASHYQHDAQRVSIAHEARTAPQVRQSYLETPWRAKIDALTRILDAESPPSAIIFCRTKNEVDDLAGRLQARGHSVGAIHGGLNQSQRERLLRAFRDGRTELLVATDVAARGLDIPDVTHVINYDIPDDADAYVHRIGRTGRMGRKGEAITLVDPRELRLLREIERQIRKKLQPLRLPTPADLEARRREVFVQSVREVIQAGPSDAYARVVAELAEQHDPLEIAAAALQLAFATGGPARDVRLASDGVTNEPGMTRLQLDAGRSQGIHPKDVVGALTAEAGIAASSIGTIDLYDDFALVEVEPQAARQVLERAPAIALRGREVRLTLGRAGAEAAGPRRSTRERPQPRSKRS
jgi:ATP-dependent RNA helicase DeaD